MRIPGGGIMCVVVQSITRPRSLSSAARRFCRLVLPPLPMSAVMPFVMLKASQNNISIPPLFSSEDNNTTHFHRRQALTARGKGWYTQSMEKMRYNISVRLFTAGKCFGPGLATLLSLVRERHSLRAAAAEMGMAYSKAWRILRDSEEALGFPLLDSTTGGRHGGGAVLTEQGAALLADYERFCERLREQGDALFDECLGRWVGK